MFAREHPAGTPEADGNLVENQQRAVLGAAGTFPDGIILAFNDRVRRHLRHYPDPAVRPGAMAFFGSAVSAPEPSPAGVLLLGGAARLGLFAPHPPKGGGGGVRGPDPPPRGGN